jgi:uncharacterized protein (DUF1330 family)
MPAYLIAQVQIHDPSAYRHYGARTPAIIEQHGGRILARGGQTEMPEGESRADRVIEFASMEAVRTFYDSPECQEVKSLRTAVSDAQCLIVQGV